MIAIDNSKICTDDLLGCHVELIPESLVTKMLEHYLSVKEYPNPELIIDHLEFIIDSEVEVRFFLIDHDITDESVPLGGCTVMEGVIYLFLKKYAFSQASFMHELVHVRQFIDKRLIVNDDGVYWEGRFFSRQEIDEHYPNLPWEKEAYGAQIKVVPINERKSIIDYLKGK